MTTHKITLEIADSWIDRARRAMGENGSNDAEHDLLEEIVGLIADSITDLSPANRLAALLNEGKGQTEALRIAGINEDDVMSEHSCLPLDDPHNGTIDLCNGSYVQRHGGRQVVDPTTRHVTHEGGTWQVHTYTNGG